MRIRYTGGIDAVDIPLPSGLTVSVGRGQECDVPDVLGAELVGRPDFESVVVKKAKAAEAGEEKA
jgi:hypothetical protein